MTTAIHSEQTQTPSTNGKAMKDPTRKLTFGETNGKVFLPDTYRAPKKTGDDSMIYNFWKVEDFFGGYNEKSQNPTIQSDGMMTACSPVSGPLKGYQVSPSDPLTLQLTLTDSSLLLIEVLRYDTFRIRWGPGKHSVHNYSTHLTRSLVMNTLAALRSQMAIDEHYKLTAQLHDKSSATDDQGPRIEWSIKRDQDEWMRIIVVLDNFSIQAWRNVSETVMPTTAKVKPKTKWAKVWSTTSANDSTHPPLLSRLDEEGNYATCLSSVKSGKMMGFGEQGGLSLLKDNQQLNLYNYDNLGYSSIYGQQAVNPSEPLYHSDPFGVELNGVVGYQSCIGIFVDDVSQLFFDLGCNRDNVMRIGSRFADLEVHISVATDLEHACLAHSACVGRGKLFPRFMLGYQQGCYGYDTKEKVMNCAAQYRKYNIPIDGIHIDVDLQERYRTFTIDPTKFPDAKGMFQKLKDEGIKCSTNITPVISTEDNSGKNYWDAGSNAQQLYKTLDQGLAKNYFVKERRWKNTSNPPTYIYYEGGKQQRWAPSTAVANLDQADTEYRGGVSYGENLGTNGVYPDLGRAEVREWWGQQYTDLFDAGLSMVWQDMTTPCIKVGVGDMKTFPFRLLLSDDSECGRQEQGILTPALKIQNLFSYNLHKATYKGLQKLSSRKGLRNFIIGRGSFTGQHRFAGTWTGDNCSSWQFLRINIQQVISMGIGGSIITGADVGGFESDFISYPNGQLWCDPSLLIRWTIANALLPWFRNHYIGKPGFKLFQEPYAYYENAGRVPEQRQLYTSVLPICRYYITLRYTLLQLLYDTYFDSLHSGRPIARSLLHTDPWDLSLLDSNSSYLAQEYVTGNDLVVAPIVFSEQELAQSPHGSRQVYLPKGTSFYDFNLHLQAVDPVDVVSTKLTPGWLPLTAPRAGGTPFDYISSIDRYAQGDSKHLPFLLPMFVREGAILPTIASQDYVNQIKPNPVTMHFYPIKRIDMSHKYDMYLDDGVSLASAPAHLPQFKLDKLSGAASDYRQLHFTQTCAMEEGKKTRNIEVSLLHSKYDVDRVKADIGSILTLQVWHDANDQSPASKGSVTAIKEKGVSEVLDSSYNASTNSTIIKVPIDDVSLRRIKFVYASL